jgi:hypothetical protein
MALSSLTIVQNSCFRFITGKVRTVDMQALYALTKQNSRNTFLSHLKNKKIKTIYYSWGRGESTRTNATNESITMHCCDNSTNCQCALRIHLQSKMEMLQMLVHCYCN